MNEKSQKTIYRMLQFLKNNRKVKASSILFKNPCDKTSIIKKKVNV